MLQQAQARLAVYGNRFQTQQFDLADHRWRQLKQPIHAVVSSLAIHHLDGRQKQTLYQYIYQILAPSGLLLIADIIQPVHPTGLAVAAKGWDTAVRQRALQLDGSTDAFDFFHQEKWNTFTYPDPMDKPSPLFDQLKWLTQVGFTAVDVYWLQAGHAIFGGHKK